MSFSEAINKFINNDIPYNPVVRRRLGPGTPNSDCSGDQTPSSETPGISYKILKVIAPKQGRNLKEAKALYRQLVNFDIFSQIQDHYELDIESMITLCQYTKFEVLRAGKIVYNKDDISNNKMYLVMNGEVTICPDRIIIKNQSSNIQEVMTPRTLMQEATQEFKRKMTRSRFSTLKDVFRRQNTMEDTSDSNFGLSSPSHKKTLSIPKINPLVQTKLTGDYFGESAIFGEKTRKESAYTLRTSELIIIDMECILRARGQYKVELNTHKPLNDFLPGINQISSLSTKDKLIAMFELMTFDRGAVLTTQGEKGDYFYIINEGECDAFGSWSDDTYSKRNFLDTEIQKQFRIKKNFTEKINLFVATPGSVVGEEILFDPDAQYDFTVIVKSSKATVFRMERVKYLMRFPKEVINAMQVVNQHKKKTYLEGYSNVIKTIIEKQKNFETMTGLEDPSEDSSISPVKGVYAQTMSQFFNRRATTNTVSTLDSAKKSVPHELEKVKKKFIFYRKKTDLSKLTIPSQPYLPIKSRNNSISEKPQPPTLKKNVSLSDIESFKLRFEKPTPRKPEEKPAFKTPNIKITRQGSLAFKSLSPEKPDKPLKLEKEREDSKDKDENYLKEKDKAKEDAKMTQFYLNSPRRRMNLKLTIMNNLASLHNNSNVPSSLVPNSLPSNELSTPITTRASNHYSPVTKIPERQSPITTLDSPYKTERSSGIKSQRFFPTSLPSRQGPRTKIVKNIILKTHK